MRRGTIFNEEKVLYFAEQESAFHVQPDEPKSSDARQLVTMLVGQGMLRLSSSSGAGEFYQITDKGRVRLLELQIKWREANGKNASGHKAKLIELRMQA